MKYEQQFRDSTLPPPPIVFISCRLILSAPTFGKLGFRNVWAVVSGIGNYLRSVLALELPFVESWGRGWKFNLRRSWNSHGTRVHFS